MTLPPHPSPVPRRRIARTLRSLAWCGWALGLASGAQAQDHGAPPAGAAARKPAATAPSPKEIGNQVRDALETGVDGKKRFTLTIGGKEGAKPAGAAHGAPEPRTMAPVGAPMAQVAPPPLHVPPGAIPNPAASRQYIRARAAALTGHGPATLVDAHAAGGEVHWSYEGSSGPQAWGQLKPEFNLCAIGRRQSPINIEQTATLQGPAEAIQFSYPTISGSVVNNGHTIQVDVAGDNSIMVRGSRFTLLQFHFHHPSEERVNFQSFAMVVHLVHRNAEGQLAVVAVLLEPGAANPLINRVWTYMPLDTTDRVRMPAGSIDLGELLPKDQRYYQFMGSLTTPPCSEGVLWMVLKQPVTVSREQLRLFAQLFPNNARPVQPINGRPVREGQ